MPRFARRLANSAGKPLPGSYLAWMTPVAASILMMKGPYSSETHSALRLASTTMASESRPPALKTALPVASNFIASMTGISAELPTAPTGTGKPELLTLADTLIGVLDASTAPFLPTVITPNEGVKLGDGKILLPIVPLPDGLGTSGPSPFGPRSVKP